MTPKTSQPSPGRCSRWPARDCTSDDNGGYQVYSLGGQVTLAWFTANPLNREAASMGYRHPQHPQVILDEQLHAVMERAAADVLYAAGFTVTLEPRCIAAGPAEESIPGPS